MIYECNFKNELINIENSYHKFRARDLEITRSCYHCRSDIDQNNCILFQIYGQRLHNIELNKLLEEIHKRKKEIMHIQDYINKLKVQKENKEKEIINLDKEIEILHHKTTKIRANDFLRSTIGEENYLFYINKGYFDVTGTNNSIYRITNKGIVSKMKIKKGLANRIKDIKIELLAIVSTNYQRKRDRKIWIGEIIDTNYPLEDIIAAIYVNIMKDSDRFDKDKGCGHIYIRGI